jgi:hypothetical protein
VARTQQPAQQPVTQQPNQDAFQVRKNRVVTTLGRAMTSKDLELSDWYEARFIAPEFKDTVTLWAPGAGKTYETGEPFVFRLLPGLTSPSIYDNMETFISDFVPGRDPSDNSLSIDVVRPCLMVERFGSRKTVAFLPTHPYFPLNGDQHPPHEGLNDNPYILVRKMIFDAKKAGNLLPEWRALGLTKKETDSWAQSKGISEKQVAQNLLLPYPKAVYFAYAWVYRAYDLGTKMLFESADHPKGCQPQDGFQIVRFNDQAYQQLLYLYSERKEDDENGNIRNDLRFVDPALPEKGAFNYIYNSTKSNPINGTINSKAMAGYTAAVSHQYYRRANTPVRALRQMPQAFTQWYYDNWQPWDSLLHATVSTQQVALIAEFFPELKDVCERAWEAYPVLMEAWGKQSWANQNPRFLQTGNFEDILLAKTNVVQKQAQERGVAVSDSDQVDASAYEQPAQPVRRTAHPQQRLDAARRLTQQNFAEETGQELFDEPPVPYTEPELDIYADGTVESADELPAEAYEDYSEESNNGSEGVDEEIEDGLYGQDAVDDNSYLTAEDYAAANQESAGGNDYDDADYENY